MPTSARQMRNVTVISYSAPKAGGLVMNFKLRLVISEGDSELVIEDSVTLEKEFR